MKTKLSVPCYSPRLQEPSWGGKAPTFKYYLFDRDENVSYSNNQDAKSRSIELLWDKDPTISRFSDVKGRIIDEARLKDSYAKGYIFDSLNSGYYNVSLQDTNLINRLIGQVSSSFIGSDDVRNKKMKDALLDPNNPINSSLINSIPKSVKLTKPSSTPKAINSLSELEIVGSSIFHCEINNNDALTLSSMVDYSVSSYLSGTLSELLAKSPSDVNNDYVLTPIESKVFIAGGKITSGLVGYTGDIITSGLVGYIIDKYKVEDSGALRYENSFISIENTYTDSQVLYSTTYAYQLRSIYAANLRIPDTNGNLNYIGTYLFSSKTSDMQTVSCLKQELPPPPADLSFYWDYNRDSLLLTWNMPVNPTRDIKGFGIYKRNSIQEPFQLIGYYDFNDSTQPDKISDSILNSGVYTSVPNVGTGLEKRPVITHYDEEFDKKSVDGQIYAVVSYDAHKNHSQLSAQFRISYDRVYNKIKKQLASQSGADIAYPNTQINQQIFPDTVFVDSLSEMQISLDPAFPKGYRVNNKDESLFLSSTSVVSNKYVISMINIDTQEHFPIEINIK